MAVEGIVINTDKAASGLFRWATTDHMGVAKNLPRGLGFWEELKWLLFRLVAGIFYLLLTWGIVLGAILFLGRP